MQNPLQERIRCGGSGRFGESFEACLFIYSFQPRSTTCERRGRSIPRLSKARQGQGPRRLVPDSRGTSPCNQVCSACHLFPHADLHAEVAGAV